MMNKNRENPQVGKEFQLAVQEWFEEVYNTPFEKSGGAFSCLQT